MSKSTFSSHRCLLIFTPLNIHKYVKIQMLTKSTSLCIILASLIYLSALFCSILSSSHRRSQISLVLRFQGRSNNTDRNIVLLTQSTWMHFMSLIFLTLLHSCSSPLTTRKLFDFYAFVIISIGPDKSTKTLNTKLLNQIFIYYFKVLTCLVRAHWRATELSLSRYNFQVQSWVCDGMNNFTPSHWPLSRRHNKTDDHLYIRNHQFYLPHTTTKTNTQLKLHLFSCGMI